MAGAPFGTVPPITAPFDAYDAIDAGAARAQARWPLDRGAPVPAASGHRPRTIATALAGPGTPWAVK